jgi:hypothetical protein
MARIASQISAYMNIELDRLTPNLSMVFYDQGITSTRDISLKMKAIYQDSLDMFMELASPAAIYLQVSIEEFEEIFKGEDNNDTENVLQNIYPRAESLELFALTIGGKVSTKIESLFEENEYPLGYMLAVLGYSPGYCGWHISGQKKLFASLKPRKIGISLNEGFLMTPLKSVSGVLVGGKREIHLFTPNYSFCKSCKTHSCLPRMKELKEE